MALLFPSKAVYHAKGSLSILSEEHFQMKKNRRKMNNPEMKRPFSPGNFVLSSG